MWSKSTSSTQAPRPSRQSSSITRFPLSAKIHSLPVQLFHMSSNRWKVECLRSSLQTPKGAIHSYSGTTLHKNDDGVLDVNINQNGSQMRADPADERQRSRRISGGRVSASLLLPRQKKAGRSRWPNGQCRSTGGGFHGADSAGAGGARQAALPCSSCRYNQWPGRGSGGGLATVELSARICAAELAWPNCPGIRA